MAATMTALARNVQYPLQGLAESGAGQDQLQATKQDSEPPSVKQEDPL